MFFLDFATIIKTCLKLHCSSNSCIFSISVFKIFSSKPLVCLFPRVFKQNLLIFLYLVNSAIPGPTVLLLLRCLAQDSNPTPWVRALGRQLERKLEMNVKDPLYSEHCRQQLKRLSENLGGSSEAGGWAGCFNSQKEESESYCRLDLLEHGTQRKRRASFDADVDADGEEAVQESKRLKMDMHVDEPVDAEDEEVRMDTQGGSASAAETPADRPHDGLPEHIRVNIVRRGRLYIFLQFAFLK